MTTTSAYAATDPSLYDELWRRLEAGLASGQPLPTPGKLLSAMAFAYRTVTGRGPTADVRRHLARLIHEMNAEHPETYLAQGVQNAMQQVFAQGVERLHWDPGHVEQHGTASVRSFLNRDRVRDFLLHIELDAGLLDIQACVRHGAARAESLSLTRSSADSLELEDLDAAQLLLTIQAGLDRAEAENRLRELERLRRRLYERVMQELPDKIDLYVDDGAVSAAAADSFRTQAADIDLHTRNHGTGAVETRHQLSQAIDSTVSYLQVFASLQRIRSEYDGLLRVLIEHKELVVDGAEGDRSQLMTALLRRPGLLESAVAMMGRRDREVRLLAARAAPYDRLAADDAGTDLTIEPSFVDDLRNLTVDDYSCRLHAADRTERMRASADVRDFILLLDRVIEATPLRRKVRLLMANRMLTELTPEIETTYRLGRTVSDSRAKAERLLSQRLRPVFVEASPEELDALRRRRQGLLMTVEQSL